METSHFFTSSMFNVTRELQFYAGKSLDTLACQELFPYCYELTTKIFLYLYKTMPNHCEELQHFESKIKSIFQEMSELSIPTYFKAPSSVEVMNIELLCTDQKTAQEFTEKFDLYELSEPGERLFNARTLITFIVESVQDAITERSTKVSKRKFLQLIYKQQKLYKQVSDLQVIVHQYDTSGLEVDQIRDECALVRAKVRCTYT